jgi:hypothetical protein
MAKKDYSSKCIRTFTVDKVHHILMRKHVLESGEAFYTVSGNKNGKRDWEMSHYQNLLTRWQTIPCLTESVAKDIYIRCLEEINRGF